MSLEKTVILGKIERLPLNFQFIQIKEVTIIKENGVEISRKNTGAMIYTPNMEISKLPVEIQADAREHWTPEVKEAYLASLPVEEPVIK